MKYARLYRVAQLPRADAGGRLARVSSNDVWPHRSAPSHAPRPEYNLAPTQSAAVVLQGEGDLAVRDLRWGLVPSWMKDHKGALSTFNARVESVAPKPAFRAAFKARRRCLIPMAGYYEWRDYPDGKQPFWIHRKDGDQLYAAGLWEPRHRAQPEGEAGSCTVITNDAVDVASKVHDRMPVFLDADLADAWMAATPGDAMAMLMASEMPALTAEPVSRAVNSSRNRGGQSSWYRSPRPFR